MNKQIKKFNSAIRHLRLAASILAEIKADAKSNCEWTMAGTAGHFQDMVREILSSDGGEAGLEPFVSKITLMSIVAPREARNVSPSRAVAALQTSQARRWGR